MNTQTQTQNLIDVCTRDALIGYSLEHVHGTDRVSNAEALYEHLLLDVNTSYEVKTTVLIEATGSTQLYINQAINGVEPVDFSEGEKDQLLEQWSTSKAFRVWQANEQLGLTPNVYLEPELRMNKSNEFKTLESTISGQDLSDEKVDTAINTYIEAFNERTTMDVISCFYQPSTAKGYLLAHSATVYNADGGNLSYFYREFSGSWDLGWDFNQWCPITLSSKINPMHIQIMELEGLLNLVWVQEEIVNQNTEQESTKVVAQRAVLGMAGQWGQTLNLGDVPDIIFTEDNEEFYIAPFKSHDDARNTDSEGIQFGSTSSSHSYNYASYCMYPFRPEDHIHDYKYEQAGNSDPFDWEFMHTERRISVCGRMTMLGLTNDMEEDDEQRLPYVNIIKMHDDTYLVQKNDDNKTVYCRIDTLLGRELKVRSQLGMDGVFSYEAQMISEHSFDDYGPNDNVARPYPSPLLDFSAGMADSLWEIFYHIPILLSKTAREQGQFDEAEYWLHKVLDLTKHVDVEGTADNTLFWNFRPLRELESGQSRSINDPDLIAREEPEFYKLAVYRYYIELQMARADASYRHPTKESLRLAKMYYVAVMHFLGDRPELMLNDDWSNPALGDVATADFKAPVMEDMLIWWDTVELRLYNLRHNLSIDGKPMHLPLLQPKLDPRRLQQAALSRSTGSSFAELVVVDISNYRFTVLVDKARSYITILSDIGRSLQATLERQDSEMLVLQQQQNQMELFTLSEDIQRMQIEIDEDNLSALLVTKESTMSRVGYFQGLIGEGVSDNESNALIIDTSGAVLSSVASVVTGIGTIATIAPNIFGFSDGGSNWGGPAQGAGIIMGGQVALLQNAANGLRTIDQYRRREEEWAQALTQGEFDLSNIETQIQAAEKRLQQSQTSLALQLKQHALDLGIEQFMLTKFTGVDLYRWMNGRLNALYIRAFDAAKGLCLQAERSLQYELCDFNLFYVDTGVAFDSDHKGLLAGEQLMSSLQRMELVHLQRNERRQEITKTISLNELTFVGEYATPVEALKATGRCVFDLALTQFSAGYPNHYQRQVKSISVSIPAVLGPYQDMEACLTQTANTLYIDRDETSEYAITNLRANQQVAISRGLSVTGLFTFDYIDPRYFPFEGSGVESSWLLEFPGMIDARDVGDNMLLDSISDIIIEVRYTAKS